MLLTKTFCKAGSLVYVVPTGLLVTLHYDTHGSLSSITKDFDGLEDLGKDFYDAVTKSGVVPYSIQLHGGTTKIWAVFYSDKLTAEYDELPTCEYDRLVSDIIANPTNYSLYIGTVDSGAASLISPTAMNTWAGLSGFTTLPTWLVPSNATDKDLESYLNTNRNFKFTYPLLSGLIVYQDGGSPFFRRLHLTCATVHKVRQYVDDFGYIMCELTCGKGEGVTTLKIHYADCVHFNIQKNSHIVLDDNTVIWCDTASEPTKLTRHITCKSCGKLFDTGLRGPATCDNPHCTSVIYPRIQRFCTVLELDMPTPTTVHKYVNSGDLTTLSDLLLLPAYKKLTIKKSICDIIFATVSGQVGLDKAWLSQLCGKCNNNYPTIKYYLDNPNKMYTELDLDVPRRFINWLSDPQNLLELDTITHSEQIDLSVATKVMKFDGPPIFRDRTIYITGTFRHGSTEDIIGILSSYGATVTTDFDQFVQGVIVGDTKENIDGGAIHSARAFNIQVFSETEFFTMYDIDSDLAKYLL